MPTTPIIRQDEVRIQKLILPDQAEEISDFLHTDFLYNEPLNAALQITAEECRELDGGKSYSRCTADCCCVTAVSRMGR